MNLLLDNERAYIGASSFFHKLEKLGVDPTLYVLELPFIFKPSELQYYVESIQNDLKGKKPGEDYEYVSRICKSLSAWAERELVVHVL